MFRSGEVLSQIFVLIPAVADLECMGPILKFIKGPLILGTFKVKLSLGFGGSPLRAGPVAIAILVTWVIRLWAPVEGTDCLFDILATDRVLVCRSTRHLSTFLLPLQGMPYSRIDQNYRHI